MAATPPWWRAANSNLSRAAIEAAYNEYFDSSSDESSPPSPPVGRQAKVPRLQAPARGIPSRAPSLCRAPSFANVELARAATLGGHAIALERRAANERYARQRRGLLRPAAVSRPSNGPAAPPPAAVRAACCRAPGRPPSSRRPPPLSAAPPSLSPPLRAATIRRGCWPSSRGTGHVSNVRRRLVVAAASTRTETRRRRRTPASTRRSTSTQRSWSS